MYLKNPKFCKKCNIIIPYDKRNNNFCNRSCSRAFININNVMTDATKYKIANTLTKHNFPKAYKCVVCNNFYMKIKNESYCSNECKKVLYFNIGSFAGKISANNKIKRSKDEIKLFELCLEKYQDTQSNQIISEGWDADISIPSLKICIFWNGPWHYKQMNFSNHSLSQVKNRDKLKIKLFKSLGWKVFVYEDRYFTPKQAFEDLQEKLNKMVPVL